MGLTVDQKRNKLYVSRTDMTSIDLQTKTISTIPNSKSYNSLSYSSPMDLLYGLMSGSDSVAAIIPNTKEVLYTFPAIQNGYIALQQSNSVAEWLQVSNSKTIIPPGQTSTLVLNVNTQNLNPGFYNEQILLTSNDPFQPEIAVPVQLKIEKEVENGVASLSLNTDTITFYRRNGILPDSVLVTFYNTGDAKLEIGGMGCLDSTFSVSNGILNLAAKASEQIYIKHESANNTDFSTHLIVCSNDSKSNYKKVVVRSKTGKNYYILSGTILGDVPSNTVLNISGDTTFTANVEANGLVYLEINPGQNITITPQKDGYEFFPQSITFNNIQTDISDIDFTATTLTSAKDILICAISISPNPAKDKITVNSSEYLYGYELLDINGKTHLLEKLQVKNPTIDISTLVAGTYILKLRTIKGISEIKVIKE
ncbi:MAG: T9SS type A sorting domain-containing protein [Bacteroidales bacterium]|nr:T9SS type A sorting domain-containing protein [Bacteroidales bacterium]